MEVVLLILHSTSFTSIVNMKQTKTLAPKGMRWSPLNNCFVSEEPMKNPKRVTVNNVNNPGLPWKSVGLFVLVMIACWVIFK